jgi:hypothetical protein
MYGIYANIWGIWMVNVAIYSIHGSYGFRDVFFGAVVIVVSDVGGFFFSFMGFFLCLVNPEDFGSFLRIHRIQKVFWM